MSHCYRNTFKFLGLKGSKMACEIIKPVKLGDKRGLEHFGPRSLKQTLVCITGPLHIL